MTPPSTSTVYPKPKAKTHKPINFKPYNWLPEAKVYNKNMDTIPPSWLVDNADVIALLFTSKGVDKDGILHKFYEIYESVKFVNLPIEVIYVPMDDNEEDMMECFQEQANWFTLKLDDPLVKILMFMYEVYSVPHMVVVRPDGTLVSSHGIMDLETLVPLFVNFYRVFDNVYYGNN